MATSHFILTTMITEFKSDLKCMLNFIFSVKLTKIGHDPEDRMSYKPAHTGHLENTLRSKMD